MNVRSLRLFSLTLAVLLFATATVSAQAAPWRVVQAGDGTLYLLKDGMRSPLVPSPISDEELAAIPDADPIYGDLPQAAPRVITVVATPTPAPVAPAPAQAAAPPAPAAPAVPAAGTRENPVPIGAVGHFASGWDVVVAGKTPDATSIVLKQNQFNTAPQPGQQFFIARVQATYGGPGSKLFDRSSLTTVGTSSVAYTTFGNSCGVYPDELTQNETFSGGTISGNVCWAIRSEDAGSLVMYDSSFGIRPEARVFMSLH